MLKIFTSITITAALFGCSSTPTETQESPPPKRIVSTLHYDYTMDETNHGFGNTAQLVPGYTHVLALHHGSQYRYSKGTDAHHELWQTRIPAIHPSQQDPKDELELETPLSQFFSISSSNESLPLDSTDSNEILITKQAPLIPVNEIVIAQQEPKTDSSSNRFIFEKFCDPLLELSQEEWLLFDELGGKESVPQDMINTCIYPKM